MAGPSVTFERRRLNEEIESAFIDAARAASNVKTKIFSGKGNFSGDLQDFYNRFDYLYRLTSNLPELNPKEEEKSVNATKTGIETWTGDDIGRKSDGEIEYTAKIGLGLFDQYYRLLMHKGIIALPTRKG